MSFGVFKKRPEVERFSSKISSDQNSGIRDLIGHAGDHREI